ncbi:MAG: 1-acyl-sn-glycerol-3-phosphate acyltransferase [Aphanocapsa sp. GSE-SYN-MK-11-07L]|nr:1-acyl-sn-glycerol-3-phosphate acyltransferase [Aphanocapsa sp. GSE-SYN-MK-11-07L]
MLGTLTTSFPALGAPWFIRWLYSSSRLALRLYFRQVRIDGQQHLPRTGPVILAPTHRSRWDALVVPYAVGRPVTGRDLRFMVSDDEMRGLQGWVIRHAGGFSVNTLQPAIAALRYGIEVLKAGESLVIFPEGNIFRDRQVQALKPGLARLALQAATARPDLKIVPIHLSYQPLIPDWGAQVEVKIGQPLNVNHYTLERPKQAAQTLTVDLKLALEQLAGSSPPAQQRLKEQVITQSVFR